MSASNPPGSPAPDSVLLGVVEHELANANAVVRGYLRMLLSEKHGGLNADQRYFAAEALRVLGGSASLLQDLRALAAAQPAEVGKVAKPLSLHGVLELAVAAAQPLLGDRNMGIELDLGADPDLALGDPDRLERVFLNLLINGSKYAPAGSRIRIQTDCVELDAGEFISVAVCDEGPGVGKEAAQRVFEPFARGAAAGGEGAGLGLAICRQTIEAHGGSIEAVPDLGYGMFRVLLPAEKPA